jgi:LSD1 subclass zinc finger protein
MQSFNCPNCNAPLNYDHKATTVVCTYCNNTVVVPEAMRSPAAPAPDTLATNPLVKDPALAGVAALLREGKRVQATIRYREVTGATLMQARIAIEQYLSGMPLERPR